MAEAVGGRLLVGAAMVVLVGVAACHSTSPGTAPSAQPGTPSPTPATIGSTTTADLTIVVDLGHGGSPMTWRLSCGPAGGDHPDPVGACQALEVNGAAALPPVAKDQACTMIYGGPQTAEVTGTVDGRKVASKFSRTNGCEIDRWSQMVPLLPEPTS